MRASRRRLRNAAALLALIAGAACATNPATGKRQLSLVGERQEIEMGRDAAEEVRAGIGVYSDARLQSYVSDLGHRLAAVSERPQLEWSFQVVDDAAVNAFALPGGFIYVTRGLLAHINSEAELAGVMGHEIGHVTARHSVNQISKSQIATLGLGLGMILKPELQQYGQIGQAGLGLLMLKYGRDDENQADELGLRYMTRAGYDPRAMTDVMTMLGRVSEAENAGRVPNWLSTHPSPSDRAERVATEIRKDGLRTGGTIQSEGYLRRIDGLVFGPDPREGFFRDNRFYHPALAFQMDFPKGFETSNQKQAVGAISPRRDATTYEFAATAGQTPVRGQAAFVEHGGHVFQILGYAAATTWSQYDDAFDDAIGSFARLTDRRYLDVEPLRLKILPASRMTSLDEIARRSPVDRRTLLLINGVEGGDSLAGHPYVKTIVGDALAAEVSKDRIRQRDDRS
jgi:predicted Zn-dependent protease